MQIPFDKFLMDQIDHMRDTFSNLHTTTKQFNNIIAVLNNVRNIKSTIFICGNGGSAATASHFVNDLVKATQTRKKNNIRAVCLNDNTSLITAIANDTDYGQIFSEQIKIMGAPGDVLIVLSASGNSINLLNVVAVAKRMQGMLTIGLLGWPGSILENVVDYYMMVPSVNKEYGLVESVHSFLCHAIIDRLKEGN